MTANEDTLARGATAATARARPRALPLGVALRESLRDQAWFIALVALYVAGGFILARAYGQELSVGLYGRFQMTAFLAFAVLFLAARTLLVLYRHRPARPLRFVCAELMGDFRLPRRLAGALPALVLLPMATSVFTSLKTMIPTIRPFDWDGRLAALDAAVHGGRQPWELLQPLLGAPEITRWVDLVYGPPWFWMLLVLQFWMIFTLDAQRQRALVSFLLCWALMGTVLATLLSSAGPVYYARFVAGADPFGPLLAYLHDVSAQRPLIAVAAQDYLWRAHLSGDLTVGVGISAMPSMHISMAVLFCLVMRRVHPALGLLGALYVVALLVGSVHLAWHYAIDGYVAVVLTWALWWAVGRALEDRRPALERVRRVREASGAGGIG